MNRRSIKRQSIDQRSAANQNFTSQAAAQREAEEDELSQPKSISQLVEEDELTQPKFISQLVEEDELAQPKMASVQLKSESIASPITQNVESAPNKTGLPDNLKSGIENLSGVDISDVKVHYNSDKPAQMNAHAFAQGTDIHVASGQEKHVAHEAWHTVQQKQGRVQPTTTVNGAPVNDNKGLETEADVMGAKASQMKLDEKEMN